MPGRICIPNPARIQFPRTTFSKYSILPYQTIVLREKEIFQRKTFNNSKVLLVLSVSHQTWGPLMEQSWKPGRFCSHRGAPTPLWVGCGRGLGGWRCQSYMSLWSFQKELSEFGTGFDGLNRLVRERNWSQLPTGKRNGPGPGPALSWVPSSTVCKASWESHRTGLGCPPCPPPAQSSSLPQPIAAPPSTPQSPAKARLQHLRKLHPKPWRDAIHSEGKLPSTIMMQGL